MREASQLNPKQLIHSRKVWPNKKQSTNVIEAIKPRRCSFFNPEGVSPLSPGLLYSATLGNGRHAPPNPNGVVASSRGWEGAATDVLSTFRSLGATTPLGLRGASRLFPRVAQYGSPGLSGETPSG